MKKTFVVLLFFLSVLSSAQNVGDAAPDFTVELLDGGNFSLSDQQGKVVFIFLFGFNCPHCQTNGPNTEIGIYQVYKNDSDFIAIGIDTWNGNASGVSSYRSITGITYPLALNGGFVQSAYSTTYDRILVVDKDGILRYKGSVNATTSEVASAVSAISTYLAMEPSGGDDGDDDDGGDDGDGSNILNAPSDDRLEFYPSPTNGPFTVSGTELSTMNQLTITDLNGKVHENLGLQNTSHIHLDLSPLKPGLYFLKLSGNEQELIRKIVVN